MTNNEFWTLIVTLIIGIGTILVAMYSEVKKTISIQDNLASKSSQESVDRLSKDLEKVSTQTSVDQLSKDLEKVSTQTSVDQLSKDLEKVSTQASVDQISKSLEKVSTKIEYLEKNAIKTEAVQEKLPNVMAAAGVINQAMLNIGDIIIEYEKKILNIEKQYKTIVNEKNMEITRLVTVIEQEQEKNMQLEVQLSETKEQLLKKDKSIAELQKQIEQLEKDNYELKNPYHGYGHSL